ncbi:MAG: hypothetical protein SX243_16995 [Acidobacteriota bacterium]|nr:hypothetical protein [Acidobacteriota bacterium]
MTPSPRLHPILRTARRLLWAALFVALTNTGCGLILDFDPADQRPLPAAFNAGCFEDFDLAPGVIFFDPLPEPLSMVAGRGRGLFADPNSRWTFVELSRSDAGIGLEVTLPGGGTDEIMAIADGSALRLTGLPEPTTSLTVQPCLDTVGLYDGGAQTFSLWNAHLDDPPDPGSPFPFTPVSADPANPPQPIAGDWDGDGTDEIGLWDPVSRAFFLGTDSLGTGARRITFPAGSLPPAPPVVTPDFLLPLAGDWNNTGTDSVGLLATETGDFILLDTLDGSSVNTFRLGDGRAMSAGDRRPLAGDWDGDGDDTVGIYNTRVGRIRLINENRAGMTEISCVDAALATGLQPVAGAWGNIGRERVLVYNPDIASGAPSPREFLLVEVTDPDCTRLSRFALGPDSTPANPLLTVAGNWDGR